MNESSNLPVLPTGLREKSNQILEKQGVATVASVDPEGYPRICVLSVLGEKEIGNIIVSTGAIGTKVAHFRENPKASVCVFDERDSVTLVGEVEFVTDMKIKKDVFLDWMYDHFTGVDDPNYCVIAFRPTVATVWIEGHFGTYRV
ncbi:MAG: pyridoxamine 5'-phosphate oxidase family protein [Clostridiales bacterium]|nr:pyridoxamine 5'-phosphate oxidase family protein [Clostridiales bacterium]